MRCSTRISRFWRVPRGRIAALRSGPQRLPLLAEHSAAADRKLIARAESDAPSEIDQGSIGPHRTSGLRRKNWYSVSSWSHRRVSIQLLPSFCSGGGIQHTAVVDQASFCVRAQGVASLQPYLPARIFAGQQVLPNSSLNRTRYGSRRKPGVWRLRHYHTPGLRRLPSRAG